MDVLIIIIGVVVLLYFLKNLRNITHYMIFLNAELPIVWVILWWVLGFLIMLGSTLYKTHLLGLQIVLLSSIIFLITSLLKTMPMIKPEDNTLMKKILHEQGYVDYSVPNAKIYYKVGIIGFGVTAFITWIILYASTTV